MTQETLTKAETAAQLIAAGRYRMANDVIRDITSPLTTKEVDDIIEALSERTDGAALLELEVLARYGLPYLKDHDSDDYSRRSAVALLDRALELVRLVVDNLHDGSEHTSFALMRPYSVNQDEWHVVDLFVEITGEAAVIGRSVNFSISYESGPGWRETYLFCELDIIISNEGRVKRFGEVREVHADWCAD